MFVSVATERRRYAAKAIDVDELRELVATEITVEGLAEYFGVCLSTIRKHLARHGLKTAWARGLRQERVARGGRPVRRGMCRRHGACEFQLDAQGAYRCLRCRSEAVMRRRRKTKALLVAGAGGRCELCGYDRSVAALHFHHLNPETKSFALSQGGFTKSLERLRREAAKCALLCSNCHAEVEAGIVAVCRGPAAVYPK